MKRAKVHCPDLAVVTVELFDPLDENGWSRLASRIDHHHEFNSLRQMLLDVSNNSNRADERRDESTVDIRVGGVVHDDSFIWKGCV